METTSDPTKLFLFEMLLRLETFLARPEQRNLVFFMFGLYNPPALFV